MDAPSTSVLPSEATLLDVPFKVRPAVAEIALATERLVCRPHRTTTNSVLEVLARPLPEGWSACRTKDGEIYYHCSYNDASQWSNPAKPWADGCDRDAELVASQILDALWMPGMFHRKPKATTKEDAPEHRPPQEHSVYDARSRHVNLPMPALVLRNSGAAIEREDLQARAFALHGLLTKEEATSIAAAAEAAGFHGSDVNREFPEELRNNSRLIHFNDALAAALWSRLAPCLAHRDIYLVQPMGFGAEGRWKPVGVNPCFRISRYCEGEHFASHRDGMYVNDEGQCSIYSIVLYLNDDFEGGELELPGEQLFVPCAGSAVLFPHDLLHAGKSVATGKKYVVRSELMFRCVTAAQLPSTPEYIHDPLFQKMAALYEQIGDLAASGNPDATTKAYQEALGIQISHQGTLATESRMHRMRLTLGFLDPACQPFSTQSLAHMLSFLAPSEVLHIKAVSFAWREASELGILWRNYFANRWPGSDEVIEDTAQGFDPEVRDWYGLYRQNFVREVRSPMCTVFLDSMMNMQLQGKEPLQPISANARHVSTGIGWDRSFKRRVGWIFGSRYGKVSWHTDGQINWALLSEVFAKAFSELKILAAEHKLIVPTLPGILSKPAEIQLASILKNRFGIQKMYFVPAPLCALSAHRLSTGTVIWNRLLGRSLICCYHNGTEVAVSPTFSFDPSTISELGAQLCELVAHLDVDVAAQVLQHIVYSPPQEAAESERRCSKEDEATKPIHMGIDFEEAQNFLQSSHELLASSHILQPINNDVVLGANTMSASCLERFEIAPEEAEHWEWRVCIQGQWRRLPVYVAGVLEGAIQSGSEYARAFLDMDDDYNSIFMFADLKNLLIALAQQRGTFQKQTPDGYSIPGPWLQLNRFLRGHPSSHPDVRKKIKAASKEVQEVQALQGEDAIHVSTLTGKLVLSMSKANAATLEANDVMQEISLKVGYPSHQLSLVHGERILAAADRLHEVWPGDGDFDLVLLVGEDKSQHPSKNFHEWIPDDMPDDGGKSLKEVWKKKRLNARG